MGDVRLLDAGCLGPAVNILNDNGRRDSFIAAHQMARSRYYSQVAGARQLSDPGFEFVARRHLVILTSEKQPWSFKTSQFRSQPEDRRANGHDCLDSRVMGRIGKRHIRAE